MGRQPTVVQRVESVDHREEQSDAIGTFGTSQTLLQGQGFQLRDKRVNGFDFLEHGLEEGLESLGREGLVVVLLFGVAVAVGVGVAGETLHGE